MREKKTLKPQTKWMVYEIDNCLKVESIEKGSSAPENAAYILPSIFPQDLGSKEFIKSFGLKYAYYGGGMANSISSAKMCIELGKAGYMGSYGSGGVRLEQVEKDIDLIKQGLPNGPYMVNLLSSIHDSEQEMRFVKMCIEKDVPVVEAAAFITISAALAYYKISGLVKKPDGSIQSNHKVIAKISREEVASRFMAPPTAKVIKELLEKDLITQEQADMASQLPVADAITTEADSGGHTDNRPLVSLFPAILSIKDTLKEKHGYDYDIPIGAAGGVSTPESAIAAFSMGASYVVTGSVNQACVEAGTSEHVKDLLAKVSMSDVLMAPSADMFEQGGRVQVTKKGTMYPMNANKLLTFYKTYDSIDDIPEKDRERIEKTMFKETIDNVWQSCVDYFSRVNPKYLERAQTNGKFKMALIFRWYLGNSSRWATQGDENHFNDMQIWCGQSLGAFNNWVKGTDLEVPSNRYVTDVANKIMQGAAILQLTNMLGTIGVQEEDIPFFEYE